MTALFYLLGFICGIFTTAVISLIINASKRKCKVKEELGESFLNIIKY